MADKAENVKANSDYMVENLLKQIERLSRENAANFALAIQYKKELDQLQNKKK